ncbi:Uncharacterised protein [Leclercia adecarboxylata]|uniref:Uncharacterized protein n=1 Tax=Leclercia adecarboxylata TaxID=83655 RepID=A0A4U9HYV2_9ENTR|nr:Uncharacterised protein [Leclercia adecarboxylata]
MALQGKLILNGQIMYLLICMAWVCLWRIQGWVPTGTILIVLLLQNQGRSLPENIGS